MGLDHDVATPALLCSRQPKPPTRGISCLELCLYAGKGFIKSALAQRESILSIRTKRADVLNILPSLAFLSLLTSMISCCDILDGDISCLLKLIHEHR